MSLPDPVRRSSILSTVIIGGGPGGLGPLIWAAQNDRLPGWLDKGVILLERGGRLGGSLGRYGINSDSLGASYLECLAPDVIPEPMRRLRDDAVTADMAFYRDAFPPLPLVDRYMGRIGQALAETVARHGASEIRLHTEARSVHLRPDGLVAVVAKSRNGPVQTLIARAAVVAVGGHQTWRDQALAPGLAIADCRARLMPSNELLSHDG